MNGFAYRSTVAVMGGQSLIAVSAAVSAAVSEATGPGDPVEVTLSVARTPREVDVPPDFAGALAGDDRARAFFASPGKER